MKPSEVIRLHSSELKDILIQNDVTNPRLLSSEDVEDIHLNILVDPTDQTTLFSMGKALSEIKKCFQVQAFLVTPNAIPETIRNQLINSAVSI